MAYAYPVILEVRPEGVAVACPDLPTVVSIGADMEYALDHAEASIEIALAALVRRGEPLPRPSDARGRPLVHLRTITQAKLLLHTVMLEGGMSDLDVARRLGVSERSIARLRDVGQESAIKRVEAALRSLGRRAVLLTMEV
jgi:antitoxin HicB